MLNIHDIYRFKYNHPLSGWTDCFPAIPSLESSWVKQDGQIFFRKELNTAMVFINDQNRGIDDFTQLYNLDRSEFRCDKIFFTIERKCGETYQPWWSGYIALVDGDYQVDKCRLEVPLRINDEYACVLRNWKDDKDFIGGPGAPNAIEEISVLRTEEAVCTVIIQDPPEIPVSEIEAQNPNTNCIEENAGWFFVRNEAIQIGVDPVSGEIIYEFSSYFVRELSVEGCEDGQPVPPPGPGWELVEDNCPESSLWTRNPLIHGETTRIVQPIPNGRMLMEVLEWMLEDCDLSLVSDFFNFNPANDHPENSAYSYAESHFQELVIFQITDVKRPTASEQATKAEISLERLLTELRVIFNAYWIIEDGTFRLEHISYFQNQSKMLDLTNQDLRKYITGKHNYSYDTENLPRRELFEWARQSDSEDLNDFDAGRIEYNETCSFDGDDVDEVFASSFMTNIVDVATQPDNYPDRGFVIAATRDSTVIFSTGNTSGLRRANAPLAWSNLLPALHIWKRPQRSGRINSVQTIFNSFQRQRLQDELQLPICCEGLSTFDPKDLVKSQLGWGEVDEAILRDPGSILELIIRHS